MRLLSLRQVRAHCIRGFLRHVTKRSPPPPNQGRTVDNLDARAVMLDVALKFLVKELDTYLLSRTGSSFGEAEIGRLGDDSGKWAIKEDHLGAALVNVEEERALKNQRPETVFVNGANVVLEPALKIN